MLFRVRSAHTKKQTPRQKWLRHIWLCPPTTRKRIVKSELKEYKTKYKIIRLKRKEEVCGDATAAKTLGAIQRLCHG